MVHTPFYLLILLIFLQLLPFPAFAQNNGNEIPVNSSLTATNGTIPWRLSPSGDFAFGFSQVKGTNQFLLCIWYAKIKDLTIVWHAKTNTSGVPQGSTLQLDAENGLVLRDPRGNRLWSSDGYVGKVAYGSFYDTGKLALSGSDHTVLWDTFSHPTDTLLPTQEMKNGSSLISLKSEANFTQGRFYLQLLQNGNLVLGTKTVPTNVDYNAVYYTSQAKSVYKLIFTDKGSLSLLKTDNTTETLISLSDSIVKENYLRLTLNFDGVLALYKYPMASSGGNQKWIPQWTQPDNICTNITGEKGSGACGYNNVCSLGSDKRPSCKCPQSYSLVDPRDVYGSCKPDFVPTCGGGSSSNVSFVEVKDTDWPLSDFEQINPSDMDECRRACLEDCFCAVAIFRSNSCWKKKLPLSNGRVDKSLGATAFLKVHH
ncbi:unnamed protein product [Cuscuta epithymum]|uniref:Bulb-type lectin domain-containing protein n=1 Tax=Cuscuta epithymum TaxID=186058 RepID=A0AAV0FGR3_9ASTE|nr:unnamed protein product [Cuscuta epithymum]